MKLAWFTPLPPAHTEIGNVSARLLPLLAKNFELTVFTETQNFEKGLAEICPIIPFTAKEIDWKIVHNAGTPIYHIGNNVHFHGEIIQVANKNPGVIVMHDLSLNETLLNIALYKGLGRQVYDSILLRYGGRDALQLGYEVIDEGRKEMHELVTRYPLFEYAVENSTGIITHNPDNVSKLREKSFAPLLFATLPYLEAAQLAQAIVRKKRSTPYKILIFGFLGNDNRRLIPFLHALAESGVGDRFEISIAGKYNEKEIRRKVIEFGLKRQVTFKGFVTDSQLDDLLRSSDLVPNLRWPSRGEASATQLRIWNFSLPSLVTRTDYYATLPEDSVCFVEQEREKSDIINHLRSFVENPDPYFEKGLKGRAHLEAHHTSESFVANLKSFLPSVSKFSGSVFPRLWSCKMARKHIQNYPDAGARSYLMNRCASEISEWIQAD